MIKNKSGIYCIERIETGQKYIGQGENVKERMNQIHYVPSPIGKAIKEYGNNSFKRYIILYCEIKDLDYYEQESIRVFNSKKEFGGYNVSNGGNVFARGRKANDKTKKKMSISQKERWEREEKGLLINISQKENKNKTNNMFLKIKGTKLENQTSKYYGVYSVVRNNGIFWIAKIRRPTKKDGYIGIYETELEAAMAYDYCVIENNLINPLNFPENYPNRK